MEKGGKRHFEGGVQTREETMNILTFGRLEMGIRGQHIGRHRHQMK